MKNLFCLVSLLLTFSAQAYNPFQPFDTSAPKLVVNHEGDLITDNDINMFPPPENSMKQYILRLPKMPNEDTFKVEIVFGRVMEVDCNQRTHRGTFTEKTLEGWGYKYTVLSNVGAGPSTKMACYDSSKVKFIPVYKKNQIERYNSQVPMVFYVPEDVTVRFRLWAAVTEFLEQ